MLSIGLLGIASSILTEVVTWVNKKLSTTPLKNDGSFIVVACISIILAVVKLFFVQHLAFNWNDLVGTSSAIFAAAEIYFVFIASKLGLTVNPNPTIADSVVPPAQQA